MRVAFLSFDFGEYCVRVASALACDATVQLLIPAHEMKPYEHLLAPGVQVRNFEKPRLRQAFRQVKTVTALVRSIRQFRPDVIHLQSGHLWFNIALPLLRRYPMVLTVHDPHQHLGDRGAQNTPQWLLDYGCRRATRLIVHAPQLKEELEARLAVPGDNIDVIPHVALGDDAETGCEPEQEQLILFFGRIWPYKGLDYLIQAEPRITAQVPGARIVIAGTGEDFGRYRAMMTNPDRFVIYDEFVSDEKRAQLFRDATVVVLPYLEASQSGVIPIAYRFGKPVVASNVGGLPAMVDDGRTGFLVPPGDPVLLAEATIRILQDNELRREMGLNARRKVDAECAPEVVARKTLSVYRKAVERGRIDPVAGQEQPTASTQR